mmetsp:Transcript_21901/g.33133  ORF Transcript_21901/g.33133 Transcript_21901/m.33133 type:complete len:236 (+) Transcript_21901:440-1147(+)
MLESAAEASDGMEEGRDMLDTVTFSELRRSLSKRAEPSNCAARAIISSCFSPGTTCHSSSEDTLSFDAFSSSVFSSESSSPSATMTPMDAFWSSLEISFEAVAALSVSPSPFTKTCPLDVFCSTRASVSPSLFAALVIAISPSVSSSAKSFVAWSVSLSSSAFLLSPAVSMVSTFSVSSIALDGKESSETASPLSVPITSVGFVSSGSNFFSSAPFSSELFADFSMVFSTVSFPS